MARDVRPRTTPGTARVELTAAQVRVVNSALALLEAEDRGEGTALEDIRDDVLERTRAKVHRAMERANVEP